MNIANLYKFIIKTDVISNINRNIAINQYYAMGLTKTEIFTEQQNKVALIAKAFGHPARIAILQHLFKMNNCICGDLVEEIGLAQPTISQHLRELKNLGLIKGNVEGTSICYCINQENWIIAERLFIDFLSQNNKLKDECC